MRYFSFGELQLNKIFGSDKGLACDDRLLKVLIQGAAGTGKTTLGLQIAKAFCINGVDKCPRFCVFCAFEERPRELERLVSNFGWSEDIETFCGPPFAYSGGKINIRKLSLAEQKEISRFRTTLAAEEILFSIDPRLQDVLDSESIPEELRQRFSRQGILLSDNVAVCIMEKGKTWLVNDVDAVRTHIVRKSLDKLIVYKPKGAVIFVRLPRYPGEHEKVTDIVADGFIKYVEDRLSPILEYAEIDISEDGGLFIFDSLNAVTENLASRVLFDKLMYLPIERYRSHSIFTMETYGSIAIPQYVADIVVELAMDPDGIYRFFQPIKARGREIGLGRHLIRIDPRKGVTCLGNQMVLYREMMQKICEIPYVGERSVLPRFDVKGLNELLDQARRSIGLSLEGLSRKLTTLIAGEPGTGKTSIAIAFFAQCYSTEEVKALFVGFSESQERILATIETRSSVDRDRLTSDGVCLWLYPKYRRAEEILYSIRTEIERRKPESVVLHDLSYLGSDEASIDLIWSILKICDAYDVTVVATETLEEGHDSVYEHLFDNVLICRYAVAPLSPNARDFRIMSVSKIAGSMVTNIHCQIFQGKDVHDIRIEPGIFEDVVKLEQHVPSFGDLKLDLYQETPGMKAFMQRIERTLVDEYPSSSEKPRVIIFEPSKYVPHASRNEMDKTQEQKGLSPDADNILEGIRFHSAFSRKDITEILAFDEIWARELILRGRLSPLNGIDPHFDQRSWPKSITKAVESEGRYYGYPFYLNVGVFCYRKDLIDPVKQELERAASKNVPEEEAKGDIARKKLEGAIGKLTDVRKQRVSGFIDRLYNDDQILWMEVFREGKDILNVVNEDGYGQTMDTKLDLFDFCLKSSEGLCSFMLELVWHLLAEGTTDDILESSSSSLLKLWEEKMFSKRIGLSDDMKTNCLFYRSWYTVYLDLYQWLSERYFESKLPQRNGTGERPKPAIVLRSMPVLESGVPPVSLSGDWFLGVLAGAINLRRGVHVLEYIIDRAMQENTFSDSLGLEPHSIDCLSIGKGDSNQATAVKLRKASKSRLEIPDYLHLRTDLARIFCEFFDSHISGDPDFDVPRVKDIIIRLQDTVGRGVING